jgi:hypothetical protein
MRGTPTRRTCWPPPALRPALQPRRSDTTAVIGTTWLHKANGLGHRRLADKMGRPASTLRRLAAPVHIHASALDPPARCTVPLAEIQEGDTIQDPKSGQWFTVTRTADGTTSVTHKHSDGDRTVIEGYRVYYGDERQGEQVHSGCIIDSRFTKGLVTRQVRE